MNFFLLHLRRALSYPHGYPLTQGCAIASSGQGTSVTVGQHSHLATPRGCPLQEVVGSQVPDALIVLEVFLQHVLSIADHSAGRQGALRTSHEALGPRLTLPLPKPLEAVEPASSAITTCYATHSCITCLLSTSCMPGAGGHSSEQDKNLCPSGADWMGGQMIKWGRGDSTANKVKENAESRGGAVLHEEQGSQKP